jgi:hypothetical protein
MNHTSIVKFDIPEHRIEYTGINAVDARREAAKARAKGRTVSTTKALVTGSFGTPLFHYTVISQEA